MKKEIFTLWDDPDSTKIRFYPAESKRGGGTVVIFAGGGYYFRAPYEETDYALRLNEYGLNTFTVDYRVAPDRFPLPLLDARRAVRFVRKNAERFRIDPHKVAVMGSSAGGHLAALTSTYREPIAGEGVDDLDGIDCLPDAAILCYPVTTLCEEHRHKKTASNLLGEKESELAAALSPDRIADEKTPPTFLWHTANDELVPVLNSLRYAERLAAYGVPYEMHIFPDGRHGLGLAEEQPHVAVWTELLRKWLISYGWME
ncbi:MAG: alpha/beta hydrolase [Clostridia bacterium]|nr:alpha/beta hydrolase [Clostridia bacterium]